MNTKCCPTDSLPPVIDIYSLLKSRTVHEAVKST